MFKKTAAILEKHKYLILCVLFTTIATSAAELFHPFYFLQDDSRSGNLPMFVHNFRSLINGELAFFNFHQYLGVPHLSSAQYGTLYPPVYAAIALSRIIFGHYFAAMDLLAFFHLMTGAAGFFMFTRLLGADEKSSLFGVILWTLNSFSIFLGSSWWVTGPVTAYMPWTFFLALRLIRAPDAATTITLAFTRLLFLLSGHVQFFAYAQIFEVLFFISALWLDKQTVRKKNIVYLYVASHIGSILMAMPMLLPMWHQAKISVSRSRPIMYGEFHSGENNPILWLWGNLYPFSIVPLYKSSLLKAAEFFAGQLNWFHSFIPYFCHIGYLAWPFTAFYFLRKKSGTMKWILLFLSLLALVWSFGFLDPALYKIPIINRFRYPFKLLITFNFFLASAAALGLSSFSQKKNFNITAWTVITVQLSSFTLLYALSPRRNMSIHLDKPPLEEPRYRDLQAGRIFSFGHTTEQGPALHFPLLGYNFATLCGLQHFGGYDPLIPASNAMAVNALNYSSITILTAKDAPILLPYLRSWGVRWYIVATESLPEHEKLLKNAGIKPVWKEETRWIFEDSKAVPLAFLSNGTSLNPVFTANSVSVTAETPEDRLLMINVVHNPFFSAKVNGHNAEIIKTPDLKMAVPLHRGRNIVVLRYSDPLFYAGLFMAAAGLLALLYFVYKLMAAEKKTAAEV